MSSREKRQEVIRKAAERVQRGGNGFVQRLYRPFPSYARNEPSKVRYTGTVPTPENPIVGRAHSGNVPPTRTPKWRRELRLLRRDGPVKYVRCALALRRFHRSLADLPVEDND